MTRQPRLAAGKRTKLGLELEASSKDILAHIKGERTFPTRRIEITGTRPQKKASNQ